MKMWKFYKITVDAVGRCDGRARAEITRRLQTLSRSRADLVEWAAHVYLGLANDHMPEPAGWNEFVLIATNPEWPEEKLNPDDDIWAEILTHASIMEEQHARSVKN